MADLGSLHLDPLSGRPVYRQVADAITRLVERRVLAPGDRLPATRELAGQLGLNRTTISAAYALLEENGLIEGQVGRGSFVARDQSFDPPANGDNTGKHASADDSYDGRSLADPREISFASSRPAAREFPLEPFRRLAKEVIDSPAAPDILQLGDTRGFGPLRRHLIKEALAAGRAAPGDDLLITNGCQQALDLIARVFAGPGRSVAVEDPVYHGMLRAFSRAGCDLFGVPVDADGMDMSALEQVLLRHRPAVVVITPSFQNPTGATLSLERRRQLARLTEIHAFILVEIDIYSALRYRGTALPAVRSLGAMDSSLLLGSYSKVSFPGLRVGWCVGPRSLIARLAEAKEISDLHSDQLSQAVLLRFAESGELAAHLKRTLISGVQKLEAALRGCELYLPEGSRWTRPEGGMNLWVDLPAPLTADGLLEEAQRQNVQFLPGRYFSARQPHTRGLRLSFGGLTPEEITAGIKMIGQAAMAQLAAFDARVSMQAAPALV